MLIPEKVYSTAPADKPAKPSGPSKPTSEFPLFPHAAGVPAGPAGDSGMTGLKRLPRTRGRGNEVAMHCAGNSIGAVLALAELAG